MKTTKYELAVLIFSDRMQWQSLFLRSRSGGVETGSIVAHLIDMQLLEQQNGTPIDVVFI